MGLYQWHKNKWSKTGCEGSFQAPGWYSKDGKLLAETRNNPKTKKPYTNKELAKIVCPTCEPK